MEEYLDSSLGPLFILSLKYFCTYAKSVQFLKYTLFQSSNLSVGPTLVCEPQVFLITKSVLGNFNILIWIKQTKYIY